jgi:hypothetical protein
MCMSNDVKLAPFPNAELLLNSGNCGGPSRPQVPQLFRHLVDAVIFRATGLHLVMS